jgi:hypothetical protein
MITMTEEPKKGKTLSDLFAEAAGRDPWSCPRCGCKDSRVESSYMTAAGRRRRRICRNCGQGVFRTTEKPDD